MMHVPNQECMEFAERRSRYCVCIPVLNEGEKIRKQLARMASVCRDAADVVVLDGGSTDGALDEAFLQENGVRTLLVKKGRGKLSAQLRMGFAYALDQGYDGVITMDGNNKDSVESIPLFVRALEEGYDFVQGSRYVPGGMEVHTPLSRKIAIRFIHAPWISKLAGYRYSDTTNGFRGHSRTYLEHPEVQPFREVFDTYELLAYLSIRAPQLGLKVTEVPVTRTYPASGRIPTKISPLRGNLLLLRILLRLALGRYHPESDRTAGRGGGKALGS